MALDKLIKDLSDMRKAGFIDCNIQCFLNQLEKIEAEEKITVDPFVAEWYEEHKDNIEFNFWKWFNYKSKDDVENKQFYMWLNDCSKNPVETLVKMKLFGYTVKKEKKYSIKLKNVQKGSEAFKFDKDIEKWYFGFSQESSSTRLYHTKGELVNAGFGWMFSCPGVEVEEVEK